MYQVTNQTQGVLLKRSSILYSQVRKTIINHCLLLPRCGKKMGKINHTRKIYSLSFTNSFTNHRIEHAFCLLLFFFFFCFGGCRTTLMAASNTAFTFCNSKRRISPQKNKGINFEVGAKTLQ